ncbi:MAG: hypothetical protein AAGF11_16080, partial [Myxococcota bacterium]
MRHHLSLISLIYAAGGIAGLVSLSNCDVVRFRDDHCMFPDANGIAGDDACRDGDGYCTPSNVNINAQGMVECDLGQSADERGCVYADDDKTALDETGTCRFECGLSDEALACIKDATVAKDQGLDCLRALYVGDPNDADDDGDGLRSTQCLEGT